MANFTLFVNSFLSYLLCFAVFVAAVLIAIFIGTSLRKSKNAKLEATGAADASEKTTSEKTTSEVQK